MTRPERVENGRGHRWTILEMIRWSTEYLAEKGVENGRLDAEHLLSDALGVDRLQLYLDFERPLTPDERGRFKPLLLRRAKREPLQYILGRTQFREIEVKTDRRALIPRPETEVLVQEVLDWAGDRTGRTALDLGTGTGVIALSLAREGAFASIAASDVSSEALALARENAADNRVTDVRFVQGDVFGAVGPEQRFDVVVSNPPYVETAARHELAPEVTDWEPPEALYAGETGLDLIRRIVEEAPSRVLDGGLLALEVGAEQAGQVAEQMEGTGAFSVRVRRDLAGRPRFVLGERRSDGDR